jgi:hypothetical protein
MSERIWVPAKPEDDFDILVQSKDHGGQRIAVVERKIDDEVAVRLYADWQGVDWADEDGMESCRIQVMQLMGAARVGDDDAE